MELKEYQSRTLEAFGRWLEALETARFQSEVQISALQGVGADIPDEIRNYPKSAWSKLAETGNVAESAGEYVDRTDEADRPIPNVCFKIPTGGGKTLLAAAALERLNRPTGLTLWLVPSRAIYQ
ncbi:MAG: DEAD/DEAH box helicase family protein, partial [Dehalococcoidia bacterium]|nr:DEAD/DEAH box helicase family protein [Dehalococcoidia bacterium]